MNQQASIKPTSTTEGSLLAQGVWISLLILITIWIAFVTGNSPSHGNSEGEALYDAWAAYDASGVPLQRFSRSLAGYVTGIPLLFFDEGSWLLTRMFSCCFLLLGATYFMWSLTRSIRATEFIPLLSAPFLIILDYPILSSEGTCFSLMLFACAFHLHRTSTAAHWMWGFLFALFMQLSAMAFLPALAISIPALVYALLSTRSQRELRGVITGSILGLLALVFLSYRNFSFISVQSLGTYAEILLHAKVSSLQHFKDISTPLLHLACYLSSCYLIGSLVKWLYLTIERSALLSKIFTSETGRALISTISILLLLAALHSLVIEQASWNGYAPWWLSSHTTNATASILLFVGACTLPLSTYWLKSSFHAKSLRIPLYALSFLCGLFQLAGSRPTPGYLEHLGPLYLGYFLVAAQHKASQAQTQSSYRLLIVASMCLYFSATITLFSMQTLGPALSPLIASPRIDGVPLTERQHKRLDRLQSLYNYYKCEQAPFVALDDNALMYYFFKRESSLTLAQIDFYSTPVKRALASYDKACVVYRRPNKSLLPKSPQSMLDNLEVSKLQLEVYQDITLDDSGITFLYFEKFS